VRAQALSASRKDRCSDRLVTIERDLNFSNWRRRLTISFTALPRWGSCRSICIAFVPRHAQPAPHPPVVSRDGRSIAFVEQGPDGSVVKVISIEGGPARDLDISADGTRIAFSLGAVNRPEIWAIRGLFARKK
jgi:hypothetical protein